MYTINFEIPTSEPFCNEKLPVHEDSRYIFPVQKENTK